jgi:hypothetical protein
LIKYDVEALRTDHVCPGVRPQHQRRGATPLTADGVRRLREYALHRAVSIAVASGGVVDLAVVWDDLDDTGMVDAVNRKWLAEVLKRGPFNLEPHGYVLHQGIEPADFPSPAW